MHYCKGLHNNDDGLKPWSGIDVETPVDLSSNRKMLHCAAKNFDYGVGMGSRL